MSTVRNIVFDVGRVLVDFSFEPFQEFLLERGARVHTTAEFIERSGLIPYEHGQTSSAEFMETVNGLLEAPVSLDELCTRWKAIFTPIPEMINLLTRLRPAYRVFLLSNSNALHWEFLEEQYGLEARVDGAVVSFRAGAMKPQPTIYAFAEERHGLQPAETLFIDDLEANVDGALARGWRGFVFTGAGAALDKLASFDVRC